MTCALDHRRRAPAPIAACAWIWLLASAACGGSPSAPSAIGPAVSPTIAAAVQAYEAYDLATSRALYRSVLARAASSTEDRVAAHRALARYAWQFDGDLAAARRELARARQIAEHASAMWAQQARIELAAKRASDALASAEQAAATAHGAAERVEAALLTGQALLALSTPAGLLQAASLLLAVLERRPGHTETSEPLLRTALALDQGVLVLAA
jgi:hypothetical protein